eukprot:2725570-Rhodomonas_salina.1
MAKEMETATPLSLLQVPCLCPARCTRAAHAMHTRCTRNAHEMHTRTAQAEHARHTGASACARE